jgi:hypothetical protein
MAGLFPAGTGPAGQGEIPKLWKSPFSKGDGITASLPDGSSLDSAPPFMNGTGHEWNRLGRIMK